VGVHELLSGWQNFWREGAQEISAGLSEETVGYSHHLGHLVLHFISNQDLLSVLHQGWVRLDSVLDEVAGQLLRDFGKHFFS